MTAYAFGVRVRSSLWQVLLVGVALVGAGGSVTFVPDGASSPAPPTKTAAISASGSALGPAIFPAKPDVRAATWADRRSGKSQHHLTLAVLAALTLFALFRSLVGGGTHAWRGHTALQPWAQRAPPLFQVT